MKHLEDALIKLTNAHNHLYARVNDLENRISKLEADSTRYSSEDDLMTDTLLDGEEYVDQKETK